MRSFLALTASAAVVATTAAVVTVSAAPADAVPASTAYALRGSELVAFDPSRPTVLTSTREITGVVTGETLVGLDVRPQDGQLYTLGVNPVADTATLYHLSEQTGYAAAIGTPSGVSWTTDGTTRSDLPDPATTGWGFDFNPAVDRIRVVTSSGNARINPNTGTAVDGDNGSATPVAGTNPDGPVNGAATQLDAAAYTNNRPDNGGVTTLYTLDSVTDTLLLQSPPNAGTQTNPLPVTLGGARLDFSHVVGLDIDATTDAATANAPVTSGVAYAALNVAGVSSLYTIDLTTGAATLLGRLGDGTPVTALALQRNLADDGQPVIGLDTAGTSLIRFRTRTPGTVSTTAISGTTTGERIAAITARPQTGQLYALGINATADTGTLYLADPQTGVLTVVGTAGSLEWSDGPATPLPIPIPTTTDLPDPATTGYGFDFNPTVDRIRISAGTFNARVNPTTGAPVDGDNGETTAVDGTNPDGSPETALTATAYTNSWGRSLPGAPADAGPTTQYVLDPAGNQLLVQNPSNAGTLTLARTVTLDGAALDFAVGAGFDISGTIGVTTTGTDATGRAVAVLTVGGTAGLYGIDLTSGAANFVGAVPTTLRSIAVGEAQAGAVTPPTPTKVPATLKGTQRPAQQKRTVTTKRTLVCPEAFANTTCTTSVVVRASGGRVLGRTTYRIDRGTQRLLKTTLTQAGVKRLRQLKRDAATVEIRYPGGAQAAPRTVRLRVTLVASKL